MSRYYESWATFHDGEIQTQHSSCLNNDTNRFLITNAKQRCHFLETFSFQQCISCWGEERKVVFQATNQIKTLLSHVPTWSQECGSYDCKEPEGKKTNVQQCYAKFLIFIPSYLSDSNTRDHYFSIRSLTYLGCQTFYYSVLKIFRAQKSSTFIVFFFSFFNHLCILFAGTLWWIRTLWRRGRSNI